MTSPPVGRSGNWPANRSDREPITCGHYAVLHSQVLREARRLLVYLPQGYDDGSGQYPTLIQLDGDKEVFYQAAIAVWYLAHMAETIPDHIVVAIENTDRSRDMAVDGGADRFLQFIEHELLPFTAAHYRTNDYHILSGQSSSSIFACYAFLVRPQLFDAYVLNSFGLSDKAYEFVRNDLLPKLRLANLPRRYLFIANGQADPYDPDGARTRNGLAFLDALREDAASRIALRYETYRDEGHVPYPSQYDGLKWIYDASSAIPTRGAK